jgi:heat-inducible transcriptional repressor
VRGYRLFVDTLLQIKPLSKEDELRLRSQFIQKQDEPLVFEQTSNMLSEVTHLASVLMLPRRNSKALRHVEFLSLSENRVLVILVINEYEVQNRIIQTSRSYSAAQLEQAANYLNAAFAGKDIKTVREDLLHELQETRQTLDEIMRTVIEEMANKAFENNKAEERDLVMSGQLNLMELSDLSRVEKLRDLFVAFNQKCDILQLLDKVLNAQGVKIFIGDESGYDAFDECSVIASPYCAKDGSVIGVLGVIGPTRMAYEKVIPIVDLTAKLLSSALNHP